uniref:Uncharacterized protein n=1 Tax=Anopheles minimus TaxID=112268 RepID=A0A182WPP3_9DIPT
MAIKRCRAVNCDEDEAIVRTALSLCMVEKHRRNCNLVPFCEERLSCAPGNLKHKKECGMCKFGKNFRVRNIPVVSRLQ